ncbi:MAG: RluA family pseudouridine synthase [Treponema sp.]|jgi:23S rRNA pseudouridine1911/1915/1917 synthase|nr:RluA family pseudouridine synthase [Treponema sp.]
MPCLSHTIEENISSGLRLDRYVSEIMRLLSRSQIKARFLKAKINGKDVKLSRPVKQGDTLELCWDDSPPENIIPQDIPLEIVYEDNKCVVINKAQGMVVHPGAGNRQGTLANALCFRKQRIEGMSGSKEKPASAGLRTGIVHRLDKETSGIIIAAYDDETQAFLCEQFKLRKVKKKYIAVVCGAPKEETGRIETFIARDPRDRKRFTVSSNGRSALTFYKVIKSWQNYSLLLLRPKTGRTHQLRVHLRYIGCPILGDHVYGYADKNFPDAELMLHSKSLAITLPGETEERVFSSPMPERFLAIIKKLDADEANEK